MRSRIIIRTTLIISLLTALLLAFVSGQNAVAQEWRFHAIVDVDDEFAQGRFPTAVNIPTDTLEKQLKTMTVDKPIVFVCATGARSGEAFFMVSDVRPDIKDVFYVEAEITHTPTGGF